MPRYDYILFDADNTLFDFDTAEHRALRETLEAHGYPFDDVTVPLYLAVNRALWHRFDQGTIDKDGLFIQRFAYFSRIMGGQDDPAEFNRDYLDRLGHGSDLLPGAEDLCRALAPHCTLAIVTNGDAKAQRTRFEGSPLLPYFSGLFISGELGHHKPEKAFFDAILQKMDIRDPSRAVVVGDNLITDIQGALDAGLDAIWYDPKDLPSGNVHPTHTVTCYEQLQALLLA